MEQGDPSEPSLQVKMSTGIPILIQNNRIVGTSVEADIQLVRTALPAESGDRVVSDIRHIASSHECDIKLTRVLDGHL